MRAVEMVEITKRFSGITVLNQVNFSLDLGEVVALMGENGAGKSTLMKILCGVHQCDEGKIYINGKEEDIKSPKKAFSLGIRAVHQELSLVNHLTVAQNIFLGREPSHWGIINHSKLTNMAQEILDKNGFSLHANKKVGNLNIANRQLLEIAKAVFDDIKILVLDEPTSALTKVEIERLFGVIRLLKSKQVAVIYISHKLDEIIQIADRIVVLKDGQNSGESLVKDVTEEKIVRMMVGRDIKYSYSREPLTRAKTVLEVENIGSDAINNVSFELKKGEILGVAGLMGSGRTELLETIFGKRKMLHGSIILDGKSIHNRSPNLAIRNGFAFATEDRKGNGLVLTLSVKSNNSLPNLSNFAKWGFINEKKRVLNTAKNIREFNIKTSGVNQLINNLSGGNQQKVVLSKWVNSLPRIFIIDEPTRGIDVGAKAEIYQLLNKLADNGISIIMVSSELPEILALSDRILVMKDGRSVGILSRAEATEETIMMMATRGEYAGAGEQNN
ncbi:MAG: sugar ABC transporter ATP-binding protein [Desulfitobacteriaceae bacterium]